MTAAETALLDAAVEEYLAIVRRNGTEQAVITAIEDPSSCDYGAWEIAYEICECLPPHGEPASDAFMDAAAARYTEIKDRLS